jgi:rhodanese-related sulfurtransferase
MDIHLIIGLLKSDLQLIDVRRPGEYNGGHAPGARNAQLADLEKQATQFDRSRATAIICASGYRSSVATSLLERQGFKYLLNVVGGTNAWIEAKSKKILSPMKTSYRIQPVGISPIGKGRPIDFSCA